MKRILVIGSTGSGKTTLAGHIAKKLNIPHVELDGLFWEPNWTPATKEVFRERVQAATQCEAWVVDGNYMGKLGDLLFHQAETVVWLDYPLRVNFWRLVKRTSGRVFLRRKLWNGNRERLRNFIDPRDSLFMWLFKNYRRKRQRYLQMMERDDLAHGRWVHIRSKGDYDAFLDGIVWDKSH